MARRTLPKDALPFAATVLVEHTSQLRSALDDHYTVALELLGFEYKWGAASPLATLIEHNPAKTGMVLVAVALAAMEGATSKNTWRSPNSDDVAYFTALQGWGYTLSDVENLVLGISPAPEPADEDDAPVDEAEVAEAGAPDSDAAESDPDDSEPTEPVDQDTDSE